jgi:hypothetical protein
MPCSFCEQKDQWKKEKLDEVRKCAKETAKQKQVTQVIYKTGGATYEFCDATETGRLPNIVEYISFY